jgi:hypothetical protein
MDEAPNWRAPHGCLSGGAQGLRHQRGPMVVWRRNQIRQDVGAIAHPSGRIR